MMNQGKYNLLIKYGHFVKKKYFFVLIIIIIVIVNVIVIIISRIC